MVLVAEFARDPFPSFFAELGLDPFSPPFIVSDKAASVFADAGRDFSSGFFAELGLDPTS